MEKVNTKQYLPKQEEMERRAEVYGHLSDMIDLKHKKYPHFSGPDGEASFLEYIERSERILNGYTPHRSESGKEDWQSNIMDNITRAKMRAICAGLGLKVPEMHYEATNENGTKSPAHAKILKEVVRSSFLDGNPVMHSFFEVWQMLAHGLVVEYDGYLSGGSKVKRVKSFNSETGEIKVEEEYVKASGKPYSIIISPNDFYWADMFKRDIQDQPRIAWLQRYTKGEVEREFGKFKNFKYIKNKGEIQNSLEQETFHYKAWSDRVDSDDYEVFRYYSKEDDSYEIWINGIPILLAPLIWGKDEKKYPFAKTISEPFANPEFFAGMSFPHLVEAYQLAKTDILNTVIDKLYRSLTPPFLVGLGNKDLLDVENDLINQDNRFYVPDVNQVKPFPYESVSQGDLAMLEVINQSIDRLSVDVNQQGQQGKGVTAREVIIADERARQLKGILFTFLEDLWLQKNKLRIETVITYYLKDKAKGKSFKDRTISVPDTDLGDGTKGQLDVNIAKTKNSTLPLNEIMVRENVAARQGYNYKLTSIPQDWLDNWDTEVQVITESLYNNDRLKKETDTKEMWQSLIVINPEFVAGNKDKMTAEFLEIYGKKPDQYNPPAQPQQQQPQGEGQEAEPAPLFANEEAPSSVLGL